MIEVLPLPATLPSLQLVYAKMQALAEPARMLLHYARVPFEDVHAWTHYDMPWRAGGKEKAPFGRVPVLVVNGEHSLDQSGAIQRYLSRLTGTCPADPVLAAQADALCDHAGELFALSNPCANFFRGERFTAQVAAFQKAFRPRLDYFSRSLAVFPSGPFFFGEGPMFCDFSLLHHFQIATYLDPEIFADHPDIRAFMTAMEALPGVQEYLASRPALQGVGTAPVLVQGDQTIKPGFG
jgi:glutathione S-transferase